MSLTFLLSGIGWIRKKTRSIKIWIWICCCNIFLLFSSQNYTLTPTNIITFKTSFSSLLLFFYYYYLIFPVVVVVFLYEDSKRVSWTRKTTTSFTCFLSLSLSEVSPSHNHQTTSKRIKSSFRSVYWGQNRAADDGILVLFLLFDWELFVVCGH